MIEIVRSPKLSDSKRVRDLIATGKDIKVAIDRQDLASYMKHDEIVERETKPLLERTVIKRKEYEDKLVELLARRIELQGRLREIRTKLVKYKDLDTNELIQLRDEYRKTRAKIDLSKEESDTIDEKIRALDEITYKFTPIDHNEQTLKYHIEERLKQILKTRSGYGYVGEDLVSIISHTIINDPKDISMVIDRKSHQLWAILMSDMGINNLGSEVNSNNTIYRLVKDVVAKETNKRVLDVITSLSKYINRRLVRKRKVSEENLKKGLEIYDIVNLALKQVQDSGELKDVKIPNLEEFKRELKGMYSNPLHYVVEQVKYGEYKFVPEMSRMYHEVVDAEYDLKDEIRKLIRNTELSESDKKEKRRALFNEYQDRLEKIVGAFEIYGSHAHSEDKAIFVNPYSEYAAAVFKKDDEHSITIAHEVIHYLLSKLGSKYSSDEFSVEKLATILHAYFSPDFRQRLINHSRFMEDKILLRNPKRPEISLAINKGVDYSNRPWLSGNGYLEGMYAGLRVVRDGVDKGILIREIARMIVPVSKE